MFNSSYTSRLWQPGAQLLPRLFGGVSLAAGGEQVAEGDQRLRIGGRRLQALAGGRDQGVGLPGLLGEGPEPLTAPPVAQIAVSERLHQGISMTGLAIVLLQPGGETDPVA